MYSTFHKPKINSKMNPLQDKFQRMLRLQSRLGDWELIRPGRELVKEGELHKISRKGAGTRYFVLLSDCLLYTSYTGAWAGDSTNLKVGNVVIALWVYFNWRICLGPAPGQH